MKTATILLTVAGATIGACGVLVLALFGFDGVWSSDDHMVASTTPALVSSSAEVRGIARGSEVLGDPSVRMTLSDDRFVGVARAADVERYLSGVPHEEVTDITGDPFVLERHKVSGTHAAAPPAAQPFWIEQGTSALRWKLADGDFRLVIMSADGASPLVTTGRFGIELPKLPAIGTVLGLLGGVLLAGAAGTALYGRRS